MQEEENMKRVLIVAEMEDGETFSPITFEVLRMGRVLAEKTGAIVCAAVLGGNVEARAEELTNYAEEVYCVNHNALDVFQVDLFAGALEELCRTTSPEILLFGHTPFSWELAPKIGYRTGSQVITDCIAIDVAEGGWDLICTKPIYGDTAIGAFVVSGTPRMATLRPKVMEPADPMENKGRALVVQPSLADTAVTTEVVEHLPGESVRMDKAQAIVAGGRGIRKKEDLGQLNQLTEVLRKYFDVVEVGATRPLVDAGWLPSNRQIGLTGEKVKPQLYIAVGISGSLQHLSGCFGAKKLVAINSDPEAPIFDYADVGVVSGYEDVVPTLCKELTESV